MAERIVRVSILSILYEKYSDAIVFLDFKVSGIVSSPESTLVEAVE